MSPALPELNFRKGRAHSNDYQKRKGWVRKLFAATLLIGTFYVGTLLLQAYEPALKSSLSKDEIGVGGKVNLTLEMECPASGESDITIVDVTPPECGLLELVNTKQTSCSQLCDGGVISKRSITFTFKGINTGAEEITPASIEYVTNDNPEEKELIKSQSLPIKVVSYWTNLGKKLLKIGFILVFICLAAGLAVFGKDFISKRKGKADSTSQNYPEQELLIKMKEFDKYQVSGEHDKYYLNIKDALLSYIKEKYPEGTAVPEELSKLRNDWIAVTESVRFSGYVPQKHEQEKLVRDTEKYLKALIPAVDLEETIELGSGLES